MNTTLGSCVLLHNWRFWRFVFQLFWKNVDAVHPTLCPLSLSYFWTKHLAELCQEIMWALPSEIMPSEGCKWPWISGNSLFMPQQNMVVSSPKLFIGEEKYVNNALISPVMVCWGLQKDVLLGKTSSPSQSISGCKKLWWVDLGCTSGAHQACHSPPLNDGGENKIEKALLNQDKGNLIRQKKRSHTKAKENKTFILYFPSLLRKSGFSTHGVI